MTTTSARKPTTFTRRLVKHVTALVLAGASMLTAAGSASAYTRYTDTTLPARPVVYSVYQVQSSHWGITSPYGTIWQAELYQGGSLVGRTQVTGPQTVTVTHMIYRWNGSAWAYQTQQTVRASLGAGTTSVKMPDLFILPTSGVGHYTVTSHYQWFNSAGTKVAYWRATMNQLGDYACATKFPCQVGDGWVYIGRSV